MSLKSRRNVYASMPEQQDNTSVAVVLLIEQYNPFLVENILSRKIVIIKTYPRIRIVKVMH